jgi:hypothetical protein
MANDYKRSFEVLFDAKNKATAAIKSYVGDLKQAQFSQEQLTAGMQKASAISGTLKTAFAALAVQQVASLFVGAAKSAIDYADSLNDLSDRTGVAVESLSTLREVVQFGDASQGDLLKAFKAINEGLADVQNGSETAAAKFKAAGLEITDSAGNIKNSEQLFREFADVIASTEDPAQRTQLAIGLLGKSGLALLPTLAQGSAGISELEGEFRKLGGEVSTTTARLSGEFNDEVDKLGIGIRGLTNDALAGLLPTLVDLAKIFTQAISIYREFNAENDALTENSGASVSSFETIFTAVTYALDVISGATTAIEIAFTTVIDLAKILSAIVLSSIALVKDGTEGFKNYWKGVSEELNTSSRNIDAALQKQTLGEALRQSFAKVKGAAKPIEDEAKKAGTALNNNAVISEKAGNQIVSSVKRQVDAQQKLIDEAVAKSKAAVDEQKKIGDEFDALARRISRSTGPDFATKFAKAGDAARAKQDADRKREEILQKSKDEQAGAELASKRDALEKSLEKARAEAEAVNNLVNRSKVQDAELALKKFDDYQREIALQKDLAAADEEAANAAKANAVTRQESLAKQAVIAQEIRDLTAQINANKKNGVISEDEIARLKDLGKAIEDSVDKGDGVLSKTSAEQYIREISALAKDAAAANAEVARQDAEKALEPAMLKLKELQQQLKTLEVEVKLDSVKKEAEKIYDTIQDKLNSNPFDISINSPSIGGSDASAFATGGFVSGPGTATSDSIPAWLSNGEFVMNANAVRHFGVNFMQQLNSRKIPAFATGGLVSNSTSTVNNNTSLNLKMPGGNVNINSSTSQASLDAALRRAALRTRK